MFQSELNDKEIINKVNNSIQLEGKRQPNNGLYTTNVVIDAVPRVQKEHAQTRVHQAFNAFKKQTTTTLINFYHRTLLSVPISMFKNATQMGYLDTWPGLTSNAIKEYCTKKPKTSKGHMRLQKMNIRTTNAFKKEQRFQKHNTGAFLLNVEELKGIIGIDHTGRYPQTSQRGHRYIFVLYDYDSNYIISIPTKLRKKEDYIAAYKEAYNELKESGFIAQLVRLNNEVSNELIKAFKEDNLDY